MSFGEDVPLIDCHQLEECDEGGDDVVEVVAAVVIAGEVRVLGSISPTFYTQLLHVQIPKV